MRPTLSLLSTTAKWQSTWLLGLRLASLQKLARATGIPSTGTRAVLAERISDALETQLGSRNAHNTDFDRDTRPLSVLSIDMGIQNLAFAHLKLDKPFHGLEQGAVSRPQVSAWRRLALSEIAGLGDSRAGATILEKRSKSEVEAELEVEDAPEKKAPASFDLPHFAETAHSLLNTLVAKYQPTHILIERQRFRSGSSSHVQEWTLRVGLFEAMLYAALETMKKERGGSLADVGVYGIDPKRVVQYWGEKKPGFTDVEEGDKKRRPTSREVKKAKIEIVAKWIETELSEPASDRVSSTDCKIDLSQFPAPQKLAEAYLERLRANAKRSKGMPGRPKTANVKEVSKLDDLADCLLQGVTWIEWIRMRELILRKGIQAMDGI